MVNLLGSSDHLGSAKILGLDEVLSLSGVYFHWYGKKYTKPFRKMGHVTVIDTNREKAIEKARFVQKKIRIETEL
jgi:5-(carboxyamino)imidazole ribonucleotide synthase